MTDKQDKQQRPRGRPPRRDYEPIPAPFEEVLKAVVSPVKVDPPPDEGEGSGEVTNDDR